MILNKIYLIVFIKNILINLLIEKGILCNDKNNSELFTTISLYT